MNQAAMQDFGRLLLRLAVGGLVLLHGVAKLRNGLGGIEGMLEARGLPAMPGRVAPAAAGRAA